MLRFSEHPAKGILQSMARPTRMNGNAFTELHFANSEAERIHLRAEVVRDRALRKVVADYMKPFDSTRLHSSIGYNARSVYGQMRAQQMDLCKSGISPLRSIIMAAQASLLLVLQSVVPSAPLATSIMRECFTVGNIGFGLIFLWERPQC